MRSGEDRGVTAKDGSRTGQRGQGQVGLISEGGDEQRAPRLMKNVEGLKLESSTSRRKNGRVDGRGGRGSVWRQDRDG